ncbi:MAG: hypothetical protein U1E40_04825 [Amaricoccus sp.]
MSSYRFRKPEYRLRLGYPEIVLEREGCAAPLATAAPEADGYAAGLGEIAAAAIPAGAPVTVVLPEPAVWRGRVDLPHGTRAARRRAARAAAAPHLGVAADAVAVTLGTPTRDGTPVAAVAHATLDDTRALVAAAGLVPAAVVGGGDFPGFPAAPRLAGASRPTLASRTAVVLGAGTIAALAALLVAQPRPQPQPTPMAAAPAAVEVAAVTPAPAPAPAASPAPLPTVRRAEIHPVARPLLTAPPPARPAPPAPVPLMGTRNVTLVMPPDGGAPEVVLPPIPQVSAPLPRPRPAAASAEAAQRPLPRPAATAEATARPGPEAPVSAAGERPLPRPAVAGGVRVASLEPAAGVASLAATPAEAAPPPRPAGLHFKAATLHAKPKVVAGTAPRKAVAAKPQPARVAAAPAPQRVVTVRKPSLQTVATRPTPTQPAIAAAPVRVASVAPLSVVPVLQPAPSVRVSPARQYPARPVQAVEAPARSSNPSSPLAVAAATQRGAAQRGGVTLIGIFGTGAGRHALLKMPNGRIQRVAAGDQVSGMQIAAVGSDSVQVNNRGRATILSLPD